MTINIKEAVANYRDSSRSEFIIGKNNFDDLEINRVDTIDKFYYFKDKSNPLARYVGTFVLKQSPQTKKVCNVTLIENADGKFEPRFDFRIINLTKKAIEMLTLPVTEAEERLIKASVSLDDCHDQFSQLLGFLNDCSDIDLTESQYAVVTSDQKKLLDNAIKNSDKDTVLVAVAEKYAHQLTDADIVVITKRKNALERFRKLLKDTAYFGQYQLGLQNRGMTHRREDVWQHFFENNRWIFGYGLQLVACEGLDDRKLETIVVGADLFDGAGKRIDSLLKTRGALNRSIFTEIKLHDAELLEKYDRSAVWVPGKELRGAVAQMEKTLHKVNLKVSQNFYDIANKDGVPTGESIAFVKPRGMVLVGTLDQFSTPEGTNQEMFASFELYRQHIHGIEILTYDELYERARFIIKSV